MAEFVRYKLDDGSEVYFETAESDFVALHGGESDVVDGGKLQIRLSSVAAAAEQVAGALRSKLAPDEVSLEFGLKVAGEVNWWFFAKNQAEGTIKVTLKWKAAAPEDSGQDEAGELAEDRTAAVGGRGGEGASSVGGAPGPG